jgi:phosphoribosylanthranilate isomerase
MILKVCGITNPEDSAAAIAGGATAIGFNFYPRSPRYIAPERAAAIDSAPGVRRVGVFVNEARARVEEIARMAALDVAQLHGDEAPADYPASLPVWKAARVGTDFDPSLRRFGLHYEHIPVEALLLDGPASGVSFDWLATAVRVRAHRVLRPTPLHIILAGGLDASNVAQAIAMVRPWGVDACSRIESAPGKKDHKKMTEFLQAAMAALHS